MPVKRKPAPADWSSFDSPILREIAEAFRHRRKAIAYHKGLSCEREFSESATGTFERMNLQTGPMRLSIWSDGEMWFNVSVKALGRNSGWKIQDSFRGNVLDVAGTALVGMFEETLAMRFGEDVTEERQRLKTTWARVHPTAE